MAIYLLSRSIIDFIIILCQILSSKVFFSIILPVRQISGLNGLPYLGKFPIMPNVECGSQSKLVPCLHNPYPSGHLIAAQTGSGVH